MTEKANEDHLTKRLLVDPNQSASDFGAHTTDRELIDEELKAFKDDYPNGGPDVPWGNSIRLGEDDCILRQLNEQYADRLLALPMWLNNFKHLERAANTKLWKCSDKGRAV